MHANYPKKLPIIQWDTLNVEYPVRKFPNTELSSETIARQWRLSPEVLKCEREPIEEIKEYFRDYNITKELTQSQTSKDFGYKAPSTKRFYKPSSCADNEYIYPPPRKLEERPPQCCAHGTTEMRSAFTTPTIAPWLITDKDQHKLPFCLEDQFLEPNWHQDIEPLDTTHEGYEKYLDPYLTTSRLLHRPFTADQLSRISASKDTVTYYTTTDTTWVRTPKPKIEDWRLPPRKPKTMYDREKFKDDVREIRTHNMLKWVPRTFRTESRDNYTPQESNIGDLEGEVRSYYKRVASSLPTKKECEQSTLQNSYKSENSIVGSGKPLCSVIDPYIEKNRRLERMQERLRSKKYEVKS